MEMNISHLETIQVSKSHSLCPERCGFVPYPRMWSRCGLDTCGEAKEGTSHTSHGILQLLLPTWLHPMLTATPEGDKNYYLHFTDGNFPGGSDGKASAYDAGDPGSISGSGRPPGEGNDNPRQYSCLENPMDGGAW